MKSFKILNVLSVFMFLLFSSSLANAKILVISPHPDDDILTASGVVYRAVQRGDLVKIVYMTNGDYNGISAGVMRQGEAVNSQAYLGMTEDNLIFLGYPDGFLHDIYTSYTTTDQTFTSPRTNQSATYGNRGLGNADYHYFKFSSHANYNSYNILKDLESIITDFRPDHIFTVGDFDSYSDHYTTYFLLRYALVAVRNNDPNYNPTIHKTCVWCDYPSWPNPIDPASCFSAISPGTLSPWGLNWNDRESLDVPLVMQSTKYMTNKKFLALSAEVSQGGVNKYGQFIHKDEIFWTENYVGNNKPPVPNAGLDQSVSEGVVVHLDGAGSHDPNADPLLFHWFQTGGIPVTLSDPNIVNPTFTAPAGLKQVEVLTFELVVNDGSLSSVPDSVNIIVQATNPDPYTNLNFAPYALVTASSENAQAGQLATKAVDGVIDGSETYPGDATKEWATNSEKSGAWLQLDWSSPYKVNRVTLYDRPNSCDQILSATLLFSDGTTLQVGPLDNFGGATEYTFPTPITVTNLKMTVTAVSSCTQNIGLAEIEVYGIPAGTQNSQTTISSSSPNPSTYGSLVVFTASVTAGATGTVTFMDGGSSLGIVTLPGGKSNTATFSTSALTGGTHSITAVYNGDTYHYTSTSNALAHTVNQLATTTNLASTSPTSTYGDLITFTATVTPSTSTGNVTFMDGGATLGTGSLSGGTTALTTSSLGGGAHSITAVYGGDSNYVGSTSSPYAQTVNKASTTIGVASSANPSINGNSVTFTATVTPSTSTGNVTFMDGGVTLGTGSLSGGTTALTTSSLDAGAHSITAVYSGDTNFSTSTSSPIAQNVNQAPTTTTISAPLVTYNTNGIVTVTVASGSFVVTGNVTLSVDDGATTTQPLSNNSASFTITSLSVGNHTLSASYTAQGNFGASSKTGTLTVNPAPTTTTISAPAIAYGVDGTVIVTVSSGLLLPTGNVSLSVDGGTPMLGSVTGTGTATFTITNLNPGTYSLYASYAAQGNFGASSASGQLSVNLAATTTTITPPATVTYGANGSVTVTVSSGAGTPTGSVLLSVDSTTLPAQGLINGSTTFTITSPKAGNHALSASYTAQGNFGASSTTGNLTVNRAVLTVTANNASRVYNTANSVFAESYSGFVNGDTQAVLSGTPLLTTTATTTSSVGTYPIIAAAGSLSAANYSFSFVNGTLMVTPASTITSVASSANPSTYGASVTFTAAVISSTTGMPTDLVTFKEGVTTLGTGMLSGGTATLTTSSLVGGVHSITVVYGGDTNFATSTSSILSQTVNKTSTTTSVTSSANPSIYGGSVTFMAAVSPTTATGTVTFMDGASTLGTGSLSGGTATCTTSTLGVGSHSITTVYDGDVNFTTSTTLSGVNHVVMPDGNLDVLKALRIAAGIDPLEVSDLVHGDVAPLVNGMPQPDGKITIEDVVMILRRAEGLSSW